MSSRNDQRFIMLHRSTEMFRRLLKKSARLSILSVRSVWFVWLHETNQMNHIDQITGQTGLVPHLGLPSALLPKSFTFHG